VFNAYGKQLKLEKQLLGKVYEVVGDIIGEAIITFVIGGKIGHAEAIKDGEPMDKQKSMLEKYELLKTNINIYRVELIQFEEEGSHEVDKISLD